MAAPKAPTAPTAPTGGGTGGDRYSGNKSRFKVVSQSEAEEDAFDVQPLRTGPRSGILFSVMNLAKGGLGGGVLAGHVAYMTAGFVPGIILNVTYGIYMCYNIYLLVMASQKMCKRCQVSEMGYPDLAESCFALFPNPKVARWAGCYRKWVIFISCTHLFGSCATYQLMIAKSIKQLVEGSTKATIQGQFGYPNLRVYVAAMIIPIICICLITQLKYLAPFSLVANAVIGICLLTTVYYAFDNNPGFHGMTAFTTLYNQVKFTGMSVFSLSCVGVVLPVENNMKKPYKFKIVILSAYAFIIGAVFTASFFGYAAFLDKCTSPLTMNFPLTIGPKILKFGIIIMVYVTHAVQYFMPFQCVFYYIKPCFRPELHFKMELLFRALFVVVISMFSIAFPNIDALMGFLGCFALSNMVIICPNTIYVMVHYERSQNRKFLLGRAICMSIFGVIIMIMGSIINGIAMVDTFITSMGGETTEAAATTTTTTTTTPTTTTKKAG